MAKVLSFRNMKLNYKEVSVDLSSYILVVLILFFHYLFVPIEIFLLLFLPRYCVR